MKRFTGILSLIVCGMILLTCLSSCGEKSDDKKTNSNDGSSVLSSDSESDSNDKNKDKDAVDDSSNKTDDKNDSSVDSEEDDLTKYETKTYSVNTLTDPNASSEDKATALQLILSNAAHSGAIASGNVPGGEKIKEKLNSNTSSNDSDNSSNNSDKNSNKTDDTSSNKTDDSSQPSDSKNPTKPNKEDVKLTGNEKTFVITVYPKIAPVTAQNFIDLVDEGFYNGMEFNRVINNFLAQAGDTDGNGTGTSGKTIKGEFQHNGFKNTLSHTKGVVSMNRDPEDSNSATSQFFICYNDECKFMDGNYAAFGKVTEGWSVVEDFQNIESTTGKDGTKSKPVSPISIKLAENIGKDSSGNPKVKFYVTY